MRLGQYGAWVGMMLALARCCAALETDQFTAPPEPLVDLGAEFQRELRSALEMAVQRVNEQYDQHLASARRAAFEFLREGDRRKAARCLTDRHIARAVFYSTVRRGYPQCHMEMWARYGQFERQPMKFDPSPGESVYGTLTRPILMFTISPTINLDGVYLGTDKLGHFFEQGYEYYEVFAREMERSGDESAAYRKAVKLGVGQEKGVYGLAVDSVYSNADLAANYAGLKFYLNLTRPIVIAGQRREPILKLEGNRWRINPAAGDDFVRPYITEHLNEAMNPSEYGWPLRLGVRDNVRKLAPRWLAFHKTTPQRERQRMLRLARWHGEEYGHSGFDRVVSVAGEAESTVAVKGGVAALTGGVRGD